MSEKTLTLLGKKTKYPRRVKDAKLEIFSNQFPDNDYEVEFHCPEFTCLCPMTAQPDFATIRIKYIPDQLLVESKSLKLYLFAYRNEGMFHEFVVNKIARDLVKIMKPKWIEVKGDFLPRGGISIHPVVRISK